MLLPDGALLTAFGTGLRNVREQTLCKMDVAMVRWRLSGKPAGSDRAIGAAAFDSDLRNKFDPDSAR